MSNFDVVVLGGGAAGLMCAIEAGKRGRSVAVLERNDSVGKKIRISGGGRCNFTNLYTAPENFISRNPSFHKSALARYQPSDFVEMVRRHSIRYHEKKLGQLFCNESSESILGMLKAECDRYRVRTQLNCMIRSVRKIAGRFFVESNHETLDCASLVVATGGLSIPRMGATDFGHVLARNFGLRVTELHPALVPLTLNGSDGRSLSELRGVSLEVEVRCRSAAFRESMLFTHRGLSGPAILQISSYWKSGEPISIDTVTGSPLPRRFQQKFAEFYAPAGPRVQWTRKEVDAFQERQRNWTLVPSGTEGYSKAEVTLGGVDTAELSSRTMESHHVPGLYFIGEVVDVTGHLGGFNFQWAWASGFAAGQCV